MQKNRFFGQVLLIKHVFLRFSMQKLAYFRKGRKMISQLVVLYNVLYGFGNKNK